MSFDKEHTDPISLFSDTHVQLLSLFVCFCFVSSVSFSLYFLSLVNSFQLLCSICCFHMSLSCTFPLSFKTLFYFKSNFACLFIQISLYCILFPTFYICSFFFSLLHCLYYCILSVTELKAYTVSFVLLQK